MSSSTQDSVRVIAPGQTYVGKQGITYSAGASAELRRFGHVLLHGRLRSAGALGEDVVVNSIAPEPGSAPPPAISPAPNSIGGSLSINRSMKICIGRERFMNST